VTGANNGPLDHDAIKRLFERVIDEARRIERLHMEGDNDRFIDPRTPIEEQHV
jgi:hypothetical protein